MNAPSVISARVAVGLLVVSAVSLLAYLLLTAFASDLRSEESGGGNALSKSAVGFAGIRFVLETAGVDARIGRTPPETDRFGVVVLTPDITSSRTELKALIEPGPRLIVLPKWITMSDPDHPGWVVKERALPKETVAFVISSIAPHAKISQRSGHTPIQFRTAFERYTRAVPDKPAQIENLQTISGKGLDACIVDERGNAILANIRGTQAYVLADPDLFNNVGMKDASVARAAFALPQILRTTDRPISFDVTLNGFGQSPELLRAVFTPPILGATICALLGAAFLAFHAFNRFGGVRLPDRAFALGKRALADNTAAVIHLMHREPAMAPRYAAATLRLTAIQLGAPRGNPESAWIAAVEKRAGQQLRFASLLEESDHVRDTTGLMQIAAKLYRWRRGILHDRT